MWEILYKAFSKIDEPAQEAWKDFGRFLSRKYYSEIVKKREQEKQKEKEENE